MAVLRCSIAYHRDLFFLLLFLTRLTVLIFACSYSQRPLGRSSLYIPRFENILILTFCCTAAMHSKSIPEYKLTHVLLFFILLTSIFASL